MLNIRGGFRKYKESSNWVWKENKCKSKATRGVV